MVASGNNLVIAIDGPAGSGKSTLSKLLAQRLHYKYVDTGAMYRAVAYKALSRSIDPDDEAELAKLCQDIDIRFDERNHIYLDGQDISDQIRHPQMSLAASKVSAKEAVRKTLLFLQRQLAEEGGVVLEGRDIGTVVCPDADFKFFLTASAEERGRRRYYELLDSKSATSLTETIDAIRKRDELDQTRKHAPLRRADDAVMLDSSGLSIEQVLENMLDIIQKRQPGGAGSRE